ncbi:unnamed protein product, partial [marine sediment metagenome]
VCNIKDFKPVSESSKNCRHYGYCNFCDVPRVSCKKNPTSKNIVLNKLYEEADRKRPECKHLSSDIDSFAKTHGLEYNKLKWFEYCHFILYSGHRHRGVTLDVGSAKSVLPYYLASKGYKIISVDVEDLPYREKIGKKFNVKAMDMDIRDFYPDFEGKFDFITNSSVIEHIDKDTQAMLNLSRYLKVGGIMVMSTDFYTRHIEYPDANKIIVNDGRPDKKYCKSRSYTKDSFFERIVSPLKEIGVHLVGATNFENVDISKKENRCVKGLYTFGIATFRRMK